MMAPPRKNLLAFDVFAGAGGLTQGLKDAGFRVVGAIEIEEIARESYRVNHPEVEHFWGDVRDVSSEEVLQALNLRPGDLDLLAGCPPCQGFSTMRTKNTSASVRDERNNLVFRFLRLVRDLRPKAVMMENVPGLVKDKRMRYVMRFLEAWGYYAGPDAVRVQNAADFGVPQRRRRMILMTSRSGAVPFPQPLPDSTTVKPILSGLPLPEDSNDPLHNFPSRHSERILRRIRAIPRDGGSRSDLPDEDTLACHRDFNGFKDVYGRMSWSQPAPTITSGCTNPSKGRFLHPEQHRAITLREAALLQGFSPNYYFSLSRGKNACAALIGNALPPGLVNHHAKEIVKLLTSSGEASS